MLLLLVGPLGVLGFCRIDQFMVVLLIFFGLYFGGFGLCRIDQFMVVVLMLFWGGGGRGGLRGFGT